MSVQLENGMVVDGYQKVWVRDRLVTKSPVVGDFVLLSENEKFKEGVPYDLGRAYLAGYIAGDGHIVVNPGHRGGVPTDVVQVLWSENQSNSFELEELCRLNLRPHKLRRGLDHGGKRGSNWRFCSVNVVDHSFSDEWGGGLSGASCYEKRVPGWVFSLDKGAIGQFIAGYFDSDGCCDGSKVTCFMSTSHGLVFDIQKLLYGLGVIARLSTRTPLGRAPIHRLEIQGLESHKNFIKWCCPHLSYKRGNVLKRIEGKLMGYRGGLPGVSEFLRDERRKETLGRVTSTLNHLFDPGRTPSWERLADLREFNKKWFDRRSCLVELVEKKARLVEVISPVE